VAVEVAVEQAAMAVIRVTPEVVLAVVAAVRSRCARSRLSPEP
jgi:hypothetical protein